MLGELFEAALSALPFAADVVSRAENEGSERLRLAHAVFADGLEHSQEGLCAHIFGVGGRAQFAQRQIVDARRVLLVERRFRRHHSAPNLRRQRHVLFVQSLLFHKRGDFMPSAPNRQNFVDTFQPRLATYARSERKGSLETPHSAVKPLQWPSSLSA